MEPELQRIFDEAAIRDCMCRYARAIDRMDVELLRTCYHPDAIEDHGQAQYVGDVNGFIERFVPLLHQFESTTHFLGQQLVEFEPDGNSAWVETYARASHRTRPDDPSGRPVRDWVLNVRYCDRFEKRNGEWKIAHRIMVSEPSEEHEVIFSSPRPTEPGTRDRSDQCYDRKSVRTTHPERPV
jgi:ketosteroid isomerase-like protein